MRTIICTMFYFVAAVMLTLTGSGVASATTLVDTTWGLGAPWQGSQNFTASGQLSQELNADVEFAVFAAGDFQGFLNENGIVYNDPAPNEFIYAYQITQITEATAGISLLSVGLQGNEALGQSGVTFIPMATDYGTYSPLPSQDPDLTGGGPGVSTSSTWNNLPGWAAGGVCRFARWRHRQSDRRGRRGTEEVLRRLAPDLQSRQPPPGGCGQDQAHQQSCRQRLYRRGRSREQALRPGAEWRPVRV